MWNRGHCPTVYGTRHGGVSCTGHILEGIGGAQRMRHGKNPTRDQRAILERNALDARKYLYVGETDSGRKVVFRDRVTGETRTVDKN